MTWRSRSSPGRATQAPGRSVRRQPQPGCDTRAACARTPLLVTARHVYIVYEYVAGRTFREAIRAGEVNDAVALEVAAQILEGLAHAHAHGVVHRDVKPANVLLEEGSGISVKIFDFGLALMHEEETLTAVGDIPGTLAYMSPERLRGETAGPASDVWAVGVLLWEALAGEHPFWGGTLLDTARRSRTGAPSLRELRPDLPRPIVTCVDRALGCRAGAETDRRGPRVASCGTPRPSGGHRGPSRRRRVRLRFTAAARAASAAGGRCGRSSRASSPPLSPSFRRAGPLGLGLLAAGLTLVNERAGLALRAGRADPAARQLLPRSGSRLLAPGRGLARPVLATSLERACS